MISFVIFSWEALISEDLNIWNLIFRLLLGFIIGVIIGARQEKRGRPAGLRTYIIISVGSTMLMILSIYIAQIANVGDPGRIAAQVVSGIGFLGAGAIIKSGVNIAGMTTAASIWTTAALGLCAGSGLIILAGLGTIVVISTLSFVRKIEKRAFKSKKNLTKLIISFRDINIKSVFQNVKDILKSFDIKITTFSFSTNKETKLTTMEVIIRQTKDLDIFDVIDVLLSLETTMKIEMKNL